MQNNTVLLKRILPTVTLGIALFTCSSLAYSKDSSEIQTGQGQTIEQQKVVNLNKSSLEQLLTLKGIGQSRAQSIIVYREQVGGFKSVDELAQVSGIGEKIMSDNKARLTL